MRGFRSRGVGPRDMSIFLLLPFVCVCFDCNLTFSWWSYFFKRRVFCWRCIRCKHNFCLSPPTFFLHFHDFHHNFMLDMFCKYPLPIIFLGGDILWNLGVALTHPLYDTDSESSHFPLDVFVHGFVNAGNLIRVLSWRGKKKKKGSHFPPSLLH